MNAPKTEANTIDCIFDASKRGVWAVATPDRENSASKSSQRNPIQLYANKATRKPRIEIVSVLILEIPSSPNYP